MACPQVADGDNLQIWRAVVNILTKQLLTAGLLTWGLSEGLTPHHKTLTCYKMLT